MKQTHFDQCMAMPAQQKSILCLIYFEGTCWKTFLDQQISQLSAAADQCILPVVGARMQ